MFSNVVFERLNLKFQLCRHHVPAQSLRQKQMSPQTSTTHLLVALSATKLCPLLNRLLLLDTFGKTFGNHGICTLTSWKPLGRSWGLGSKEMTVLNSGFDYFRCWMEFKSKIIDASGMLDGLRARIVDVFLVPWTKTISFQFRVTCVFETDRHTHRETKWEPVWEHCGGTNMSLADLSQPACQPAHP